ncbi:MAG: DUF4124 domain-containing protein [Cellvibrionaceae bacterium]
MNYSKLLISAITLSCIASTPAIAAKNYYKWTDANGVTHYSAQRPNGTEAETVVIKGGRTTTSSSQGNQPAPKPTGNTDATEPTTVAEKEKTQDLKDPTRCKAAKENVETIKNHARIRVKDDNGEYRYLDEQEKTKRLNNAQQAIKESC